MMWSEAASEVKLEAVTARGGPCERHLGTGHASKVTEEPTKDGHRRETMKLILERSSWPQNGEGISGQSREPRQAADIKSRDDVCLHESPE